MSTYALEKTHIPQRNFPPAKIWPVEYDLIKTTKIDRPGWIPLEITDNWDTNPYAYQTEEEQMPQGGPHGQLSSYLSELLRSYLEQKDLMLLFDSFMLYRDQKGIKRRIGPDLLLMPLQKPAPTSYDLDISPPPSLVVEITSPESHDKDLDHNLSLYANLGISTYLVIDLMVPNQNRLREQIELHVFRWVSGKLAETKPDKEGYFSLPEMGLKIRALGQEIRLVDQLTDQVLLDMTKLKEVLEAEVERAEVRANAEAQRANAAEQRAQAEAQRAEQEKQRAEAEAERANAEVQRANTASLRAQAEAQRAQAEAQRAQAEAQRAERLTQLLREQGIDPDKLS